MLGEDGIGFGGLRGGCCWGFDQLQGEAASFAYRAFQADGGMMFLGDRLGENETDSGAGEFPMQRAGDALKSPEDSCTVFWGNADAGVFNADDCKLACGIACSSEPESDRLA